MRPLTSQSLYHFMKRVAPESLETSNPHQIALDFVLSNPDVSVAICGMRTIREVLDNISTVDEKNGAGILSLTAVKAESNSLKIE